MIVDIVHGLGIIVLCTIMAIVLGKREVIIDWVGGGVFWGIGSILLIGAISSIVISWIHLQMSQIIITQERIIHVYNSGPLSYTVRYAPIYDIQELSGKTSGILSVILGYGQILIRTKNQEGTIQESYIPDIHTQIRKINEILENIKKKQI